MKHIQKSQNKSISLQSFIHLEGEDLPFPANDNLASLIIDDDIAADNDNEAEEERLLLSLETGISSSGEEVDEAHIEDRFFDGNSIQELDFSHPVTEARGFLSEE